MDRKKESLGKLALLCTAMIWGTSFVVLKSALNNISTMWVLAIRFSVSAVLMLLFAGKRILRVSRRCLKGGVMLGLSLAVAYLVQTYGLLYTTPGKNAFLTATYCVLTPFLAWLVYKRRPGMSNIVAAFACITGIGFVSLSEGMNEINIGDMLTLLCGIFYSIQIIVMEQYRDSGDALTLSALEFTTAALFFWIGALIFESAPHDVPASTWAGIAYLSVMCTAVCFFMQAWGMKYTSSSTAAMLMTLESVFGVLVSVLFYNEKVTAKILTGFVLIFAAVVISELRPFERRAREPARQT